MDSPPQRPAAPISSPLCGTCGQGAMVKRKTWRMSGPVVAIGFILLVPSVLGILFGGLIMLGSMVGGTQPGTVTEREIRAKLTPYYIPPPIADDVAKGNHIDQTRLASLTPEQQRAVHDAELTASSSKAGAALATGCGFGLSILIVVGSFVGGLLGWLLIMRKTVLQCVRCGAVVAAS